MIEYRGLSEFEVSDLTKVGALMSLSKRSSELKKRAGFIDFLSMLVDTGKTLGTGSAALTGITLGLGAHSLRSMIKKRHKDETKIKNITKIYEDAYDRLSGEPELW